MNVNDLKGRIAEALVQSIFRRAQYRVTRAGRESHVPGLLRQGPAEFSPDFIVWKPVPAGRRTLSLRIACSRSRSSTGQTSSDSRDANSSA